MGTQPSAEFYEKLKELRRQGGGIKPIWKLNQNP
jgi:hypothetical protein